MTKLFYQKLYTSCLRKYTIPVVKRSRIQFQLEEIHNTLKNKTFPSQESGISFMSPKGHILMTRYIFDTLKATDKLITILEPEQIGDKDPTLKNQTFPSQESGISFMSTKGHK